VTFVRFVIRGKPDVALSPNAAAQIGRWIEDKRDVDLRELGDRISEASLSAARADETSGMELDLSPSEMRTILEILDEHDEASHPEFVRLREALEDFLSR